MVFSSFEFLFLFLPLTFAGFLILRRMGSEQGIILWLVAASLLFYGWWHPPYLFLLLGSTVLNYLIHRALVVRPDKALLAIGIIGNLAALGYFKYANFFVANVNGIAGTEWELPDIALPLAISFFTFQQISLLCDTYRRDIKQCDFPRYLLFVSFFPQLIAGPIVLQKDTIPQFKLTIFSRRLSLNVSVGLTLIAIGLFKKIVLADGMAPYANTVFGQAETTHGVPLEAAWIGALAYTFQIYFDFSGYCDMALGAARLFGIRLPANFNSPYKATSIVDFWRRWHMTLSRFLRDYLYIPLGGNRKGPARRYVNLAATMVIGGLWHGASWTFVVWGALHGIYLTINHAWNAVSRQTGLAKRLPDFVQIPLGQAITILAVIVAWVFFRAESFNGAFQILEGMVGQSMAFEPEIWEALLTDSSAIWIQFAALAAICLLAPNSIELTEGYTPTLDAREIRDDAVRQGRKRHLIVSWRPTMAWAGAMGVVGLIAIIQLYRLGDLTEFIYFNF